MSSLVSCEIIENLEIINNQVFANSLFVAKIFNKRHDNIIKTIENLPNDEFKTLNFEISSSIRKNGLFEKDTKFYNLTRDGFSLLVMGFTGEKAYKWKIEFIKAFNEMEKRLKNLEAEQMQKLAFHQSLGYKSQLEQQKINFNNEIKALKYDLIQTKDELDLCKGALEVLKRREDFNNEENLRLLQEELAKYGLVIFNELDFALWSENLTKNIIGETKRRLDDLTRHNYELLKEKFDKRLKVKK
ncbi:Rha family transcriptional regulator [Campylobacter jejuni]|nr:Rha family transcriptional regulator [Campylobacter jejuni]ECO2693822.1 Rha family transcriptional regulator [Campylobacter jejuni]EDP5756768.1 Rha family transcriptional regulator [Campylobacter jejuni]